MTTCCSDFFTHAFLPILYGVACVRACAAPRRALPLQLLPLLTRPGPAQHGPTRMPARPKRPDSDAGPPKTARLGCRPQTSATSGRAVTGGPRRGPVALPARRSRPPVGRPGRPGLPSPGRRLRGFKLPSAAGFQWLAPSRPGDECPGPPRHPPAARRWVRSPSIIRVTQRTSSWAAALGEPRRTVPAAAGNHYC